jgi:hypothetical protein
MSIVTPEAADTAQFGPESGTIDPELWRAAHNLYDGIKDGDISVWRARYTEDLVDQGNALVIPFPYYTWRDKYKQNRPHIMLGDQASNLVVSWHTPDRAFRTRGLMDDHVTHQRVLRLTLGTTATAPIGVSNLRATTVVHDVLPEDAAEDEAREYRRETKERVTSTQDLLASEDRTAIMGLFHATTVHSRRLARVAHRTYELERRRADMRFAGGLLLLA